MKAAAIQMNSGSNVDNNLAQAEALTRAAREDGAGLIVLPEAFAYLGPEDGMTALAEDLAVGGPILERCQKLARETEAELVLGGFWEKGTGDLVRNACVHLTETGEVKSIYRKIHLFDVDLPDGTRLQESETVEAGTEVVVTETKLGKLGLSVCYDVRFPELYRKLVDKGATLITVPAAFTMTTGKDHWHVLLRARAIESQSYVIAAAQAGYHYGNRTSYGHALIVDPWGIVVSDCAGPTGYAITNIDMDRLNEIRQTLPSLAHRVLSP